MPGEKILVVDDNPRIIEAFELAFEEYTIVGAQNGKEALVHLKKPNNIDLVILDEKMPGLTGTDTLKEIKKIDPALGVIMFTEYGLKDVMLKALQEHADDFIDKPFNRERIAPTIRKLLDRARARTHEVSEAKTKTQRVVELLKRNHDKHVSLRDAAAHVCSSAKYLSRLFKDETGKSFTAYRREVRVDAAKRFLKESAYDVKQIAYRVGYENPESFMRVFKRVTGCTPTNYRRRSIRRKEHVEIRQ